MQPRRFKRKATGVRLDPRSAGFSPKTSAGFSPKTFLGFFPMGPISALRLGHNTRNHHEPSWPRFTGPTVLKLPKSNHPEGPRIS